MVLSEWQKVVFKAAIAKAKEIRKKNPNIPYPTAIKQAWKDPAIVKLNEDYKKKHGTSASKKKKGGAVKRGRPKSATGAKKTVRRTAKRSTKTSKK